MVDFMTPYAVDDSVIPGAGLRRQLHNSSGGARGVVRAGDLKVSALDTPGPGVKIAAGDDLVVCRAPGRERETYGVTLQTSQDYLGEDGSGIPGTGSSGGRRDMIIHEVVDPSLPVTYTPRAEIPAGVYSKITVVPGVPADARTVDDVPALNDVTCYELAAINWPASRATVEEAFVEDLRQVSQPRREDVVFARPRIAADGGAQVNLAARMTSSSGTRRGEYFPGGAGFENNAFIDFPEWPTRMVVEADWMSIRVLSGINQWGRFWMEYGTEVDSGGWAGRRDLEFYTQDFFWDTAGSGASNYTTNWRLMDSSPVPAKLRGKRVRFIFKAGIDDGAPAGSAIQLNGLGGLGLKVTFAEVAADDFTL